MKPEKEIYENQKEVHDKIVGFAKSILPEDVKEAYLFGSSTTQNFGRYVKKFRNREGSDIDLVVMISEDNIPKNWKYLNTEKDWWRLYSGGDVKINNTSHKIDLLVVKPGKEDFARKRIKNIGGKPEKLK